MKHDKKDMIPYLVQHTSHFMCSSQSGDDEVVMGAEDENTQKPQVQYSISYGVLCGVYTKGLRSSKLEGADQVEARLV